MDLKRDHTLVHQEFSKFILKAMKSRERDSSTMNLKESAIPEIASFFEENENVYFALKNILTS